MTWDRQVRERRLYSETAGLCVDIECEYSAVFRAGLLKFISLGPDGECHDDARPREADP